MKLWIDDVRPAPDGYWWIKTTDEACSIINRHWIDIDVINIDHDAGAFAVNGGDYIKVLDFIEYAIKAGHSTPNFVFHIHSMNPVGVQNMRAIIKRNNWKEV